ncbi:hypothetical protein RYX36_021143 [Vicia faba]
MWNNGGSAATTMQYQLQYSQWANYYSQTTVSCAPTHSPNPNPTNLVKKKPCRIASLLFVKNGKHKRGKRRMHRKRVSPDHTFNIDNSMTTPFPHSKVKMYAFARKLFDKIHHGPFREVESESKSEISSMKKCELNEIHTESSFEYVSIEPDFVNLDPTVKLSPPIAAPPVSYTHVIIDPVDADPSMSPYDYKKNHLSPRPQLLHYRPKPQMELEDKFFMYSSFSDLEVTENTQSEESLKESEDVYLDETVKQEESLMILLLSIAFVSISIRVSKD